jgi:hypothetical protein
VPHKLWVGDITCNTKIVRGNSANSKSDADQ